MDVRAVTDGRAWDRMLFEVSYPPFTQLWSWGEGQKALGKKVVRLCAQENGRTLLCQWVEETRRPLTYWFAPQGPVVSGTTSDQAVNAFLEACRPFLPGGMRVCFHRAEPRWRSAEGFDPQKHVLAPPYSRVHSMNPSTSFVVPLDRPAEALLETFHKKTRYNIRLAERHGVTVRLGVERDWPTFLGLLKETMDRHELVFHTDKYLTTMYRALLKDGRARLRLAEYQGEVVVANLEVLCGDTVMYLYGASSSRHRDKMAPFALQWSAISSALAEGYRWYDFGGGNPTDPASVDYLASWEGITRFKEQWGTERLIDPGTFDAPKRRLLYRLFVKR